MNGPTWWDWELELSFHLEKRMLQRDFTEIDLRTMLDRATGYEILRCAQYDKVWGTKPPSVCHAERSEASLHACQSFRV